MSLVESWNSSYACLTSLFRKKDKPLAEPPPNERPQAPPPAAEPPPPDANSLVDQMLYAGRYALLLRPQLTGNLTPEQLAKAQDALGEGMCLIPPGEVLVQQNLDFHGQPDPSPKSAVLLEVEAYFLDRHAVTNRQYQKFIAAGGYEQMALWDPEIWPAVLDFVDQTGHPGPRFWRQGSFPHGEELHPVVGVSWYEAAAFARWSGKRLPTDAEWVKAATWPVAIPGHPLLQRRYPWGEAIDRQRANLWGSGLNRTVRVDEFPDGASVGGPLQLIGNVWEWTSDEFQIDRGPEHEPDPTQPKMFSVRGGAFDTYLDCQSTCQFQSGDRALARKHNIGFRCAISVFDVVSQSDSPEADEDQTTLLEANE